MVKRPCAIKVRIEVVVRNDNTSTDISIILPHPIRHSIFHNYWLMSTHSFIKKSILNSILSYFYMLFTKNFPYVITELYLI